MTVAFRADADVTNQTAGTSVTVSRPTGTTDGDLLLALIAEVGTGSITAPAGWTLIGSQAASTTVTLAAYRRTASSEPSSWTWTLGSSQRNWGWVGAYTGVDTAAPITEADPFAYTTTVTTAVADSATLAHGGVGVTAIAAVRGTGSATTWTTSGTERADLSTAAGSGTNIAGCVMDTTYTGGTPASYAGSGTASQSQTSAVVWAITLAPALVPIPAGPTIAVTIEAAYGAADRYADPDTLTWTDISADLLGPVTTTRALGPDSPLTPLAPPASLWLALRNLTGDHTPDNPAGAHYPHVVAGVPIRVTVPYGYGGPEQRAYCWVESWTPTWDESTRQAICEVVAYGALSEVQANLDRQQVRSALYQSLSGLSPESGIGALDYWPCEDGADATQIASATRGRPLRINGQVEMASAIDLPGSAPLPVLAEGGQIIGFPESAVGTGAWTWLAVVRMPETPVAADAVLLRMRSYGSAPLWHLVVAPGSPDTVRVRAYKGDDLLLDNGVAMVEADFYGRWLLVFLQVRQDGSDVDYEGGWYTESGGTSTSGTLAGRTIGAPHQIEIKATADLAGMAVGHVALFTDVLYNTSDLAFTAFTALDGNSGERPWFRFARLAGGGGFRNDIEVASGATAINMGPQLPGTLSGALEECAAADHGLAHDAGPDGELVMVSRAARYNRTPDLVLDVSQGHLAPPLTPTYTSRSRIGDSTVFRVGGSSGRYVDPAATAPRPDQVSLNLETDAYLEQIAGWRVGVSGAVGMRYPALGLNLRRSPELLGAWLAVRPGLSRVTVSGMWATHGQADIDQMVDGWTETIGRDRWEVSLHCSPAAPYDVAVIEATDETVWQLDTDTATLDVAVDADDTSLVVQTVSELLSTAAGDYPVDLDLDGERVTATACSGGSSPQTVTVVRGVDGYAAAHPIGTVVRLWRPRGLAL